MKTILRHLCFFSIMLFAFPMLGQSKIKQPNIDTSKKQATYNTKPNPAIKAIPTKPASKAKETSKVNLKVSTFVGDANFSWSYSKNKTLDGIIKFVKQITD